MAEDTAGTPDVVEDDGTPTGAGTPQTATEGGTAALTPEQIAQLQADAAEAARLKAAQQQWLGEKDSISRERDDLRRQLAGGGVVPPTYAQDPRVLQAQQLAQDYAISQDPNSPLEDRVAASARLNAANINYTRNLEGQYKQEAAFRAELDLVPIADRPEVERRARQEQVMPSWAHKALNAERWEQSQTQSDAERKRKEAEEALRRTGGGKPATVITPVAGGTIADAGFTEDEYAELVSRAGPPHWDMKARKRLDDIDLGRVKPRAG
jgi:hypothetical protein